MSNICNSPSNEFTVQGVMSERSKAHRNSYWLLSLESAFVGVGAFLGLASGYSQYIGAELAFVALILASAVFIKAVDCSKSDLSDISIVTFFNVVTGFLLTLVIEGLIQKDNASSAVMTAFVSAFLVFLVKACVISICKENFSKLGSVLFSIGMSIGIGAALGREIGMGFWSACICILLSSGYVCFCAMSSRKAIDRGSRNSVEVVLQSQVDFINGVVILVCATGLLSQSPEF
jgi:FtsH-binding integral membrane protein